MEKAAGVNYQDFRVLYPWHDVIMTRDKMPLSHLKLDNRQAPLSMKQSHQKSQSFQAFSFAETFFGKYIVVVCLFGGLFGETDDSASCLEPILFAFEELNRFILSLQVAYQRSRHYQLNSDSNATCWTVTLPSSRDTNPCGQFSRAWKIWPAIWKSHRHPLTRCIMSSKNYYGLHLLRSQICLDSFICVHQNQIVIRSECPKDSRQD